VTAGGEAGSLAGAHGTDRPQWPPRPGCGQLSRRRCAHSSPLLVTSLTESFPWRFSFPPRIIEILPRPRPACRGPALRREPAAGNPRGQQCRSDTHAVPRPKASTELPAPRVPPAPLRRAWLVLPVCRQAGHLANVIKRLVSLERHQSFDHELIAAPFDGTYPRRWPSDTGAAPHVVRLGLLELRWPPGFWSSMHGGRRAGAGGGRRKVRVGAGGRSRSRRDGGEMRAGARLARARARRAE
jgi:hypothetical protein